MVACLEGRVVVQIERRPPNSFAPAGKIIAGHDIKRLLIYHYSMHRSRSLPFLAFAALLASWDAFADEEKKQIFMWQPERSPAGPILIIVNIDDQAAFIYRNGIQIGQTPVSTGRPGFATPTGVFSILGKDATHHSKKYLNAPTPVRSKDLPGRECSYTPVTFLDIRHRTAACIWLAFAKDLFETTQANDTTVVITQSKAGPRIPLRHSNN